MIEIKTTRYIGLFAMTAIVFSCNPNENKPQKIERMNPFFEAFSTPFGVPPFNEIRIEDYKPAFERSMKEHVAEIEAIVSQKAEPDFENTVVALSNAGLMLERVSNVFFNLTSANTNDEMEKISEEIAPKLSQHNDAIYMNATLFERIQTVWNQREALNLTEEQMQLLAKNYKAFVRNGANLNDEQKAKLSSINQELSVLTLKFGQNSLSEVNEYQLIVDDKEKLKGLPDELLYAAAETAKSLGKEGQWVFTLQNPSVMPFLQYAENRELRKEIWQAFINKGNNNDKNDNKELLAKMVSLRAEKAAILGYETHAHYVLEEQMAKNPQTVMKLLTDLWKPALAVAKKEELELQEMMRANGVNAKLEPFDWRYYAERIRVEKYELNEQELKPYFSLNAVRDGIFMLTENLYGLKYIERNDLPKYHEEVTVYEVQEKDGQLVGILYMDFHPRASKRGGAWMTSYSSHDKLKRERIAPVISIVCNFSKATADAPALLSFDEVETYFHEFGHALHGLLSNVNYRQLAGTNVPTDFVELPSQIMENWASEPEMLKMYAKHYKTGEVIPDELIQKMINSGKYGQGFATVEYLAASILDMNYHSRTKGIKGSDVEAFENDEMRKIGLIETIVPRYRSTYFNHIFAGGYSAGYYSYIWSGVLDTDAFEAFKETSLFNQEKAQLFRSNVLEKGGTADPMELYKRYRGQEPSVEPLLRKRGLN
jgi:peptidyl-dipeptidase Dcp